MGSPESLGGQAPHDVAADERWRAVLNGDVDRSMTLSRLRRIFRHLPSDPRCKLCYAPYAAPFGPLVRLFGFGRWDKNPSMCGSCLRIMERYGGGAEVELSLLFADLRGSTELAARIGATAYGRLLNAFYRIAAAAIEERDGNVDKYLGDGVFALFIPGFTGPDHAQRAVEAARQILQATADGTGAESGSQALPIGIGVHTGPAYVGVLGEAGGVTDFTAIGDAVNVTERLSSVARARQLVISDDALAASGIGPEGLARAELTLKGVAAPVAAWTQTIGAVRIE